MNRLKKVLSYILRGDLIGLYARIKFLKKEILVNAHKELTSKGKNIKWAVITPGHTNFVAQLIADNLRRNLYSCEVFYKMPKNFDHDLYIVLCPQIFKSLPPSRSRICFQMEQSVSSRWFTEKYLDTLKNSLAVLEYSLVNLEYLKQKKIAYPHVYYMPIGAIEGYCSNISVQNKKYEIIFYGDSLSSNRRSSMLEELKKRYNVHVINNLFFDDLILKLKQSKVVINLHYYDNSLLEMPRIQECLSLGLKVVSESSQDQNDYPRLGSAVQFFEVGSVDGMISAIELALQSDSSQEIHQAVLDSQKHFSFMFDRFLISMGFLDNSDAQIMQLPLPKDANTFALSLPETITRRRIFENIKPLGCHTFDGIRQKPGWVGCGLSYAALARHALDNNLSSIMVMEDDVILPKNYYEQLECINLYLKQSIGEWDIFSGLIASLHPETKVLKVDQFMGRTFVTIDKMTSTVLNIYSESALRILSSWNPGNLDAVTNTIDKYLENQKQLRVVVLYPFFVGHREEVDSTLWGFQNTTYSKMIRESESLLHRKIQEDNLG